MLDRDDRGLALALVSFIALLVVCGLLFVLFDPAVSELATMTSNQADSQTTQTQIDQAQQFWGLVLTVPIFLGLLYLVGRGVFESEVR
jgi:K+-transporting ATPase c subunit